MTAPDLKPCPFCGGKAAVWTTDAYSGDSAEHVLGCKFCDIYMPFAGVFNSKVPTQDAITAWNTRTTPLAEALAVPEIIAGRSLSEWAEFARRDDCLDRMVPSDLRQLVAALRSIGDDRA